MRLAVTAFVRGTKEVSGRETINQLTLGGAEIKEPLGQRKPKITANGASSDLIVERKWQSLELIAGFADYLMKIFLRRHLFTNGLRQLRVNR
jgi:hypothetical protein